MPSIPRAVLYHLRSRLHVFTEQKRLRDAFHRAYGKGERAEFELERVLATPEQLAEVRAELKHLRDLAIKNGLGMADLVQAAKAQIGGAA